MDAGVDKRKLREILEQYTYGKYEAIENAVRDNETLSFNSMMKVINIPEFYWQDTREKEGECLELADKVMPKLKQEFPDWFFCYCAGTEPDYFQMTKHWFIAASRTKVIEDKEGESDVGRANVLLMESEDVRIIDPSFKKTRKWPCRYGVMEIYGHGFPLPNPANLILGDHEKNLELRYSDWISHQRPIGINRHNQLIHIMVKYGNGLPKLGVALHNKKGAPCGFIPVDSKELSRISDERLEHSLEKLGQLKLEPTNEFYEFQKDRRENYNRRKISPY